MRSAGSKGWGMVKPIDLTGQRFGRLTALKMERRRQPSGGLKIYWQCRCDCGSERTVSRSNLRAGATKSCGCLQRERVAAQATTHGLTEHPLFNVRYGMINRCHNPNDLAYKNYGERGITVCAEWREDFQAFYDWALSVGWEQGLQIDRIDNNRGYDADNCRFVTATVNNRNRRSTVFVEYRGERLAAAEFWEAQQHIAVVNKTNFYERLKKGWSAEDAAFTPAGQKPKGE